MNFQILRTGLLCITFLGISGSPASAAEPAVHILRTPDGGVQPDAVLDAQGVLHVVYLKGDPAACDVFYVKRPTGESRFSTPLRVNSQPGSAVAAGTIRGAQLSLGRNGRLHVAWNGSGRIQPKSPDGVPMLYTRLNDAGDGFEPQRNLMTATIALDGGGSVAADARGNVHVVWHAATKDAPKDETHRAVFIASSKDDGKTFSPERAINPEKTGACACCSLEAFVDSGDRLSVLYRSANPAGTRDLTWLLSDDAGHSFKSTQLDTWRIATCPMSSMMLVKDANNSLRAAWETQGQVYQSTLRPQGLVVAPRHAPAGGAGDRKHPVLATRGQADGPALMAWAVGTGWQRGGSVAWELTGVDGKTTTGHADGLPVWGRPAAVAEADGTFTVIY